MRLRACALPFVAALVGCTFNGGVPPEAQIVCSADARGCPEGLVCVIELGRCVSRTQPDHEAPSVVSTRLPTAPLRRGETLRVEITVSEALGVPPRASMTQASTSLLLERAPGGDERTFFFERRLTDDVLEGVANLSIDLMDVFGNVAQGVLIGAVTMDFTPPRATSVAVLGPRDPIGGLVDVRPGERIALRVSLSETVRAGARVTATSAACDAGISFPPVAANGPVLDVSSIGTGPTGCTYAVAVEGLADLAGNPGDSPVPLDLTLRVDGTPPVVSALQTLRPLDGGWVPAATFSRAPGFDTIGLRFEVDESTLSLGAAVDAVNLAGCDLNQCGPALNGQRRCFCSWAVSAQDVEGAHSVSVTAADAASNARSQSAPVRYDFTAPGVLAPTTQVLLSAPMGSLVSSVSALGVGGTVQVVFSLDEPGTARIFSAPVALPFTLTTATTTSFVFAATLGSAPVQQGAQALTATVADDVGNSSDVPLQRVVVVDTEAPPAPDVATLGSVVYHRLPWGRADAGPSFDVTGAPGTAEPNATLVVNDPRGSEVGRTTVRDAGSFDVTLVQADRAVVSVRAIDNAGNAGPSAEVREVRWTATLAGKVLGSVAENPNRLEVRRQLSQSLTAPDSVEVLPAATISGGPTWVGSNGPPATANGAMAYDADRQRVLVFTGTSLYEWDGASWLHRSVATPGLASRTWPSLAYDARRKKLVLFGGFTSAPSRELWEWDGQRWQDRTPTVGGPTGRYAAGMVYDSARGRIVVFGGTVQTSTGLPTNEVWEWDGATWTNRTPPSGGPSARYFHYMVYDSARQRTVVFSGYPLGTPNDVWEWDGTTWTQRPTPMGAPSSRFDGAAVYDSIRQRVVISGGNTIAAADTWEWDGSTWTNRTPMTGGPGARSSHDMAFDAARGVAVLFSGFNKPADIWEWDGTSWRNPSVGSAQPSARDAHAMAYDVARQRTVLFGGQANFALLGDTWEWDGNSWAPRTFMTPVPAPRRFFSMAYDSRRNVTTLFGGDIGSAIGRELWELGDAGWVNRTPPTGGPAQRNGQVQAYDSARGVTVMFAGSTGSYSGETWEWDGGWNNRTTPGPAARWRASACYDTVRATTLVFGGIVGLENSQELWAWNGTSWLNRTPDAGAPNPPARYGAAMAWDSVRNRAVLFSGGTSNGDTNDVWEWDGARWQNETGTGNGPSSRTDSAMAFDARRARMVLFGGSRGGTGLNDTWEWGLDPASRPVAVLHVPFSYAAAPGATVIGVDVQVTAGGSGSLRDGGATAGALLSTYGTGEAFVARTSHSASDALPATLRWSTSAPNELSTLFVGSQAEIGVAVSPQGTNGAAAAATVTVTDAELTVRYRRP